jgi:hypothetical protein
MTQYEFDNQTKLFFYLDFSFSFNSNSRYILLITQLLECVNDDQVTYYASGNHDLQPSEGGNLALPGPKSLSEVSTDRGLVEIEIPLPLPPPTPISVPENNVLAHSTSIQVEKL